MDVFQTDHDGFFVGVVQADPDPLTEGNWLIPGGCVTVAPPSLDDGQRARWVGDDWQVIEPEPEPEDPGPLPLSVADVIAERERRLALGFDHDFGDERGVHRIGTTREDMAGWDEVDKLASNLRAAGMGSQTITVLTDTGPVEITADEWPLIMLAAAAFRQPIWGASFALSAMDPIPADYADDAYWP